MIDSPTRQAASAALARARHNLEIVAGELALSPEWANPKNLAFAMTAFAAEAQTAEILVDEWLGENAAGAK